MVVTPVDGTQFLSAGDYTFFCTIHPSTMQATLHVAGAGAPLARPSATVSLRTRTISKALKKGFLVGVNATTKDDGVSIVGTRHATGYTAEQMSAWLLNARRKE